MISNNRGTIINTDLISSIGGIVNIIGNRKSKGSAHTNTLVGYRLNGCHRIIPHKYTIICGIPASIIAGNNKLQCIYPGIISERYCSECSCCKRRLWRSCTPDYVIAGIGRNSRGLIHKCKCCSRLRCANREIGETIKSSSPGPA